MAEISNKTIMGLLAVALFVTVAGTTVSVVQLSKIGGSYSVLTGAQTTETGTVSLTVEGDVSIDVQNNTLNFISGYYNNSCTSTVSILDEVNGYTCFLNASGDEVVENESSAHTVINNGTLLMNLSVSLSNVDNSTILCGTNNDSSCNVNSGTDTEINVSVDGGDAAAGTVCPGTAQTTATPIANGTTTFDVDLCTAMSQSTASNELLVYYSLSLPYDVVGGSDSKTFTVTYTAAST